jgi:hypothetical protein
MAREKNRLAKDGLFAILFASGEVGDNLAGELP